MESETDLDETIKNLKLLSQAPQLYPVLIELNAPQSLLGLLVHENSDIVVSCLELLNELIDEDLLSDPDNIIKPSELAQMENGISSLIKNLIENKFYKLLEQNLATLDETKEEERNGIYLILSIIESIGSIQLDYLELVLAETNILEWITSRIKFRNHIKDPLGNSFDQNAQYSSEVLAILLQASSLNRIKFCGIGGVDTILRVLSQYKKRDPVDREEVEFMENLFNCLNSILQEKVGKSKFFTSDGIVLMLILLKSKKMSRIRSLETINFSTLNYSGAVNCFQLVKEGGLSPVFSALMKKKLKQYKKSYPDFNEVKDEEHCVSILTNLLVNLKPDTLEWSRVIRKFFESDMEKVDRIVEIFLFYIERMQLVENNINDTLDLEALGDDLITEEERIYSQKLELGLFTLQMTSLILVHLCYYEQGLRNKVEYLLKRRSLSLSTIDEVLKEYVEGLGNEEDEGLDDPDFESLNYRVLEWMSSLQDDFVPPVSLLNGNDEDDDEVGEVEGLMEEAEVKEDNEDN
jgi:beta-catenin-like protein 1